MAPEDLNSDPHTCAASALPTEPSPQPWLGISRRDSFVCTWRISFRKVLQGALGSCSPAACSLQCLCLSLPLPLSLLLSPFPPPSPPPGPIPSSPELYHLGRLIPKLPAGTALHADDMKMCGSRWRISQLLTSPCVPEKV